MKQALWLVVAAAAGCAPTSSTFSQAGTVPAPRPLSYDGQPMERTTRVEARYASVVTPLAQTGNEEAGNYVARTYSGLGIRGGRGNFDGGLDVEAAWTQGSDPVAPGLDARPGVDFALTFLNSWRASLPVNPQFRVGLAIGFGFISVPVRVNGVDKGHDEAGLFQLAIVPSYRAGPVTVFAGVNLGSEAEVPRSVISEHSSSTPEAYAKGGAIVLSGGATMSFASGLRITGQVAQPTTSELADHGLQLDLTFGFDFGARSAPRPAPVQSGPPGSGPY